MKIHYLILGLVLFMLSFTACHSQENKEIKTEKTMKENHTFKVSKSEEDWKKSLSAEEYAVLRQAGTERPHTGKYNMHFEEGTYACNACGEKLFESDTKFDAHCGWPSFDKAIDGKVVEIVDNSLGMKRTEIVCANCGSHLGHVFNDGPTDTGLRYCMNSVSLDFEGEESADEE